LIRDATVVQRWQELAARCTERRCQSFQRAPLRLHRAGIIAGGGLLFEANDSSRHARQY
jgi:hypothetical protein